MGWIGWVILAVVIVGYIGTYAILKAGSDYDDLILGDDQYRED